MLDNLKCLKENVDHRIIYSFAQSKLGKDKIHGRENKIIIPLFLYYDDFQVNNPLGSHAGSQKLGAVYVSFGCLPPELSSLVDNIFLASLFKTDDLNTFGNKIIFKDLIEELQFLEISGIDITANNKNYKIFFTLGLIVGDNLGLHTILGFVQRFVACYPCRFCKTYIDVCHTQIVQDDNNLRNTTNYSTDILTNNVSITGINELFVWNQIDSFSVTSNYSVDTMHDLL